MWGEVERSLREGFRLALQHQGAGRDPPVMWHFQSGWDAYADATVVTIYWVTADNAQGNAQGFQTTIPLRCRVPDQDRLHRLALDVYEQTPQRQEQVRRAAAARVRGEALLTAHLTPTQRACYAQHGYFGVQGGDTGRTYQIGPNRGVYELDAHGCHSAYLCVYPPGGLAPGDIALAQKNGLELYESALRQIAVITPLPRDIQYLDMAPPRAEPGAVAQRRQPPAAPPPEVYYPNLLRRPGNDTGFLAVVMVAFAALVLVAVVLAKLAQTPGGAPL